MGTITYTYGSRTIGEADIVIYNDEYPVTEKVFSERWPSYMIPVDIAFNGVEADLLGKPGEKEESLFRQKLIKENAIAIGIGAGVLVFVIGGLIVVIIKRKRRRW